jgi:hypothetical protein
MTLRTRLQIAAALRQRGPTPIGALVRGMAAGVLGAAAQLVAFNATARLSLAKSRKANEGAPEPEAEHETVLETTVRRASEGLLDRPIDDATKERAALGLHFLYGAAWGGIYGLWRESARAPATLFGMIVWATSDNALLPAMRLAAWPNQFRARDHLAAIQHHLVYGTVTGAAYSALRRTHAVPLAAIPALVWLQFRRWLRSSTPKRLLATPGAPAHMRVVNHFLDHMALA